MSDVIQGASGAELARQDRSGTPEPDYLLDIEGLEVVVESVRGRLPILNGMTLRVARGESLGIVGESGSGKSMTLNALLGLLPGSSSVSARRMAFGDTDLLTASDATMRELRGGRIGTILQDPNASLNPCLRIGSQVAEPLRIHRGLRRGEADPAAADLIGRVGIIEPERRVRDYPHEFSGGMKQRIVGASAISCDPELIIADEPTTALDVTVQAAYLELLNRLRAELGSSMLFISHDLGVVARVCDRVAVVYAGRVVETAPTDTIFAQPRHPYTMGLVSCLPSLTEAGRRLTPIPGTPPSPAALPAGCSFAPRCPAAIERCHVESPPMRTGADGHEVACHRATEGLTREQLWPTITTRPRLVEADPSPRAETRPTLELREVTKRFVTRRNLMGRANRTFDAVRGVSVAVRPGETVSIVGESGSGKTTCIRMALGLVEPSSGEVTFRGTDLAALDRAGRREYRRRVQAVFQDPFTSFNPRIKIARAVAEPLLELGEDLTRAEITARVDDLLGQVGLEPARVRDLFPHQLSGGQRQRVAIARAMSTDPECLVLDEPVSALDVSIRVQILNLLADLQDRTGVGILAISHDLGSVKYMSDRVVVMKRGEFVEEGSVDQIYESPKHEYTRQLLADAAAGDLTLR